MSEEKRCGITDLPEDVLPIILSSLGQTSQTSLSQMVTSNRIFGCSIFQEERIKLRLIEYIVEGKLDKIESLLKIRPDFVTEIPEVYEKALFRLASSAEQDKMEPLLKEHPELLLKYGPLKDISGAYFKNITLFQHAVWAGDVRYMCGMMLDCLPKNELGEKIRLDLVRQFNELMNNGLEYVLNGDVYTEKQFSLQALINALRTYTENFNDWTWEERDQHWSTVVGACQKDLPAHVRHHYCDPKETFYPTPTFTKNTLARSLRFYNCTTKANSCWDASLLGIGLNFGGAWPAYFITCQVWSVVVIPDLIAIETLCNVRTNTDLPALKQRLENPILGLEEYPDLMAMTL